MDGRTLTNQGNEVRNNYNHYDSFRGDWWNRHRGAWRAGRWAATGAAAGYAAGAAAGYGTAGSGGGGSGGGGDAGGYAYSTPTWAYAASYGGSSSSDGGSSSSDGGSSAEPVYYDYGSNVVYDGDNVYVNGDAVATQEEYAQQATTIADTGKKARATKEDEWLPLGVFAMVQGEQKDGNDLFQLAVNKSGVIRGNYYNPLSDTTLPVYGSVDKKSQRAAWKVGDRKEPVFEAGFANLTKSETTMLVHWGKDRTQQWTLVRIDRSAEPKETGGGAR